MRFIDNSMLKIESLKEMTGWSNSVHCDRQKIGFVPTMGALHQGHLSLIAAAKKKCDLVVVSIFVNPLQFNEETDFVNYPVDLAGDFKQLEELGVDVCFLPTKESMYQRLPLLNLEMPELIDCLCGKDRPGYLEGVMLIVAKLFNVVKPDEVFFGQKDYQQCLVVKRLIEDLNYDLKFNICPTVRDESGLALSSRNRRLSPEGLQLAASFVQILCSLRRRLQAFLSSYPQDKLLEKSGGSVINLVKFKSDGEEILKTVKGVKLEYLEICCADDLGEVVENRKVLVAVAFWVEGVRLIDNLLV